MVVMSPTHSASPAVRFHDGLAKHAPPSRHAAWTKPLPCVVPARNGLAVVPPPAPRPEPAVISIWRGQQDAVNALPRETYTPVDGFLAKQVLRVNRRSSDGREYHAIYARAFGAPGWLHVPTVRVVEGYAADAEVWTWLRSHGVQRRAGR